MPPNTAVCRSCLAVDVRLIAIAGTPLQLVFEKLTSTKLQSSDGRPMSACYLCHAQLKKCRKFMLQSARAEDVLTDILKSSKVTKQTVSHIDRVAAGLCSPMIISGPECLDYTLPADVEIKIEQHVDDDNADVEEGDVNGAGRAPPKIEHVELSAPAHVKMEPEDASPPPADMASNMSDHDDDPTGLQREAPTVSDLKVKEEMEEGEITSRNVPVAEDEDELPLTSLSSERRDEPGARGTPADGEADQRKQAKGSSGNKKGGRDPLAKPGEKSYNCHVCQRSLYSKHILKVHMRTHTGEKPYKCDICHRQFAQPPHLRRHLRTHTGEKPYKCEICDRKFAEKSEVNKHMKSHNDEKPFECNICHQKFKRQENFKKHYQRHTDSDAGECEICHRWFMSAEKFKTHSCRRTGEKPYKCTVCPYTCQVQSVMKEHLMRHAGEKTYACNVCNSAFYNNSRLKNHLRSHTGEKPFECDYCQSRFSKKDHLRRHINIHTNYKLFACSICVRSYNDRSSLLVHMRTHTGEKPFACTMCEKRCKTSSALKKHVMSHTGEKPFACTVCQKRFGQKARLLKHSSRHTAIDASY